MPDDKPKNICQTCGKQMHWHGDPIGGYMCDDCDSETLSRWLRSDPYDP